MTQNELLNENPIKIKTYLKELDELLTERRKILQNFDKSVIEDKIQLENITTDLSTTLALFTTEVFLAQNFTIELLTNWNKYNED